MTDTIESIIADTYGSGPMPSALAADLRERIERNEWDSRGREHNIMLVCWAWFPGGSTAASTAKRIEAIL